jgi:hypothetical protein
MDQYDNEFTHMSGPLDMLAMCRREHELSHTGSMEIVHGKDDPPLVMEYKVVAMIFNDYSGIGENHVISATTMNPTQIVVFMGIHLAVLSE